jgi:RNA polymerase sigma-70 factor (ECF subfamily)
LHPHDTIERIATEGYARLLAIIASRTQDISAAEDALSDAFHAALKRWPVEGVPDVPEAWLITAAKRRLTDHWRHLDVRSKSEQSLQLAIELTASGGASDGLPEKRLNLLFVCAHPAIDPAMRAPLMLQTVLGLDAGQIASAFLVAPSAMSQRLVRAKNKIKEARIPFRIPEVSEMPARLESVLEAIYAAYSTSWQTRFDVSDTSRGLNEESLSLAQVVATLMPNEAEAAGLWALLLYCEARQLARRDQAGNYVPLDQQDVRLWDQPRLEQAEEILLRASRLNRPGRFQLEAAIQSAHADRKLRNRPNWPDLILLYRSLLEIAPSIGSQVAYAATLHQAGLHEEASDHLSQLPKERVNLYQPYWATLAHILSAQGLKTEAASAFRRAAGLSLDEPTRRFLLAKLID